MKKIYFHYKNIKNYLNARKIILSLFFLIVLVSAGTIASSLYQKEKNIKIGFITDIHAGNQDIRTEGIESNNILYPIKFEKNLKQALENMKDCDLIVTLGDNLNSSSKKYAQKLLKITKHYPMIWTKGNHENDETFKLFKEPKNYYYKDKGKWRIIILDNGNIDHSVDYAKGEYIPRGYMEPEQIEWLKETLKTDKKIVIAMHVPVFERFNADYIYPSQQKIVDLFEKSGNVRYVLAGHFHINNWHKNINGIEYYILPSLSLDGQEGYSMKLSLPNK